MNGASTPAGVDGELAGRIRGFVGAMPAIDTQRHELKQQLGVRFAREVDRNQVKGPEQGTPPNPTSGPSTEPRG